MNCKERVLEFKSIRKAFPGVLALDDVSFNISRGEVHGLVGENGAGKSTLIKILCGVYQADGGTILIDGKDACIKQPLDAQRAGIQVMHQEINVVPDMTVAENSAMRDMNLSIPVAIIMGLSVGIITGIVNGVLIALLNMPAFITTMGTMTIIRGLGFIYTGAYPVYGLPAAFKTLGQGYVGIVPIPTIIFVAVALIASFILRKTVFGRHIYAIGGNESAAKLAGIRVPRIKIAVYILSGFIASIAAVIQAARIGAGMPTIGEGFELDAVAAAVIGGAAMSGGSGTVLGTVLGSIVLGVLSNGLSLLDVDSYVMEVIRGLVVIIAVLADQLRIVMANRAKIKSAMQALKQESEAKEK